MNRSYRDIQSNKTIITPKQLFELLSVQNHSCLAIVQGESGSGKTRLMLQVVAKFKNVKRLFEEELVLKMVEGIRNDRENEYLRAFLGYKIIIIEDIDLLKGKIATQKEISHFICQLLKADIRVLITGIHLERRVPPLISAFRDENLIWMYI